VSADLTLDQVLDVLHLDGIQFETVLEQRPNERPLRRDRAALLKAKVRHKDEAKSEDDGDGVTAKGLF